MKRNNRLKAALTVEASLIIGLCLIIFGEAINLAYDTFYESLDYVSEGYEDVDVISIFKLSDGINEVFGGKNGN